MQQAPETATRGPPKPYIIDGRRFCNVQDGARIVRGINQKTLWRWAKKGVTSFGFELDVKRLPMIHHARAFRHNAKFHLESRMVISGEKLAALKEILEAAGRENRHVRTRDEMAMLEAINRRRNHRATLHS